MAVRTCIKCGEDNIQSAMICQYCGNSIKETMPLGIDNTQKEDYKYSDAEEDYIVGIAEKEDLGDKIRISIQSEGYMWMGFFLMFLLCIVVKPLFSPMCFSTLIWYLWLERGQEVIIIDKKQIQIINKLWIFKKEFCYSMKFITNLSFSQASNIKHLHHKNRKLFDNCLKFDYNNKSIPFALGMQQNESEYIIRMLLKKGFISNNSQTKIQLFKK